MVRTALACVVLGAVALAGCTTSRPDDQPPGSSVAVAPADRAAALWDARTAYVGDNSKVIALVDAAGFAPRGTYTLSLATTRRPYAVTVALGEDATPAGATAYTGPATVLLGTVGNLDEVHVTAGGETWTLTSREATDRLGHDVRTLGSDRGTLEDYVRTLGG